MTASWDRRDMIVFSTVALFFSIYCFRLYKPTQDNLAIQNSITLVTAWYPPPTRSQLPMGLQHVCKDQEARALYVAGVRRFLSETWSPIVIYTTPLMAKRLESLRNASLPTKFVTSYEEVWDIPIISPLREQFHTTQRALDLASSDPDREHHIPSDYAVWNAKPFLLNEVANLNPFNSSYFFWHDFAAMRASVKPFRAWPSLRRVDAVLSLPPHVDTILLNVIGKQPCFITRTGLLREPPEASYTISAALFGGSKAAVNWLHTAYYKVFEYYLSKGAFVGREERNLHALALLAPRSFTAIPSWTKEDTWEGRYLEMHRFFYLNFLALREEMWDVMRYIPYAPLFQDVPSDGRCAGSSYKGFVADVFRRLSSLRYWVKNLCEEVAYQLKQVMRQQRSGPLQEPSVYDESYRSQDIPEIDLWS